MPCRDDRDSCSVTQSDIDAAVYRVRQELEPMLCEACTHINDLNVWDGVSQELRTWYEKHEECEKHRVAYEAALRLSPRERRLLGINIDVLKKLADEEKVAKVKKR
jgi:hypothetical protein